MLSFNAVSSSLPKAAVTSIDGLPYPRIASGKVREIFDLGDSLLLSATDRLSAFDVVLPDPIPDKGRVLSEISAFWFEKTRHIVPKGALLDVYLLTTVDTGNPSAVIQFGVARDLVFNHLVQLAFGARLLGRLSGRAMRGRLNLAADTVLFPDGLELPANASAVEADELGCNIRPGVAARYVPPPAWVRLTPYASDLFTGFMGLLESRATSQVALGMGGVTVQEPVSEGMKGPALQASAQAVQDFTRERLREMEERYAPCYLIPAGTACCLQLESDLDLGPAHGERRPARAGPGLPVFPDDSPHAPVPIR